MSPPRMLAGEPKEESEARVAQHTSKHSACGISTAKLESNGFSADEAAATAAYNVGACTRWTCESFAQSLDAVERIMRQVFGSRANLQTIQGTRQFMRVRFEDLALSPWATLGKVYTWARGSPLTPSELSQLTHKGSVETGWRPQQDRAASRQASSLGHGKKPGRSRSGPHTSLRDTSRHPTQSAHREKGTFRWGAGSSELGISPAPERKAKRGRRRRLASAEKVGGRAEPDQRSEAALKRIMAWSHHMTERQVHVATRECAGPLKRLEYATQEDLDGAIAGKVSLPHWAWATVPTRKNLVLPVGNQRKPINDNGNEAS